MAVLVRADGTAAIVYPRAGDGAAFTLEELQAHVGGYIEIVPWPRVHGRKALYGLFLLADEEGKLTGKPRNEAATRLIDGEQEIVGDVLLLTPREFGE